MNINQYYPDSDDPELIDFINAVTNILNRGRVSVGTSTIAPSNTDVATTGEKRIAYIGSTDVRDYSFVNGQWYFSQIARPSISGWGYIEVTGSSSALTKAVNFPSAIFSSPPFVQVTYIGVKTTSGAPSGPEDFDQANTLRCVAGFAPSTVGFTAAVYTGNGSGMTDGQFEGFSWTAYQD